MDNERTPAASPSSGALSREWAIPCGRPLLPAPARSSPDKCDVLLSLLSAVSALLPLGPGITPLAQRAVPRLPRDFGGWKGSATLGPQRAEWPAFGLRDADFFPQCHLSKHRPMPSLLLGRPAGRPTGCAPQEKTARARAGPWTVPAGSCGGPFPVTVQGPLRAGCPFLVRRRARGPGRTETRTRRDADELQTLTRSDSD